MPYHTRARLQERQLVRDGAVEGGAHVHVKVPDVQGAYLHLRNGARACVQQRAGRALPAAGLDRQGAQHCRTDAAAAPPETATAPPGRLQCA